MIKLPKAIYLSISFVLVGFLGSAVRYWRWWPSHTASYFIASGTTCPLCPNVEGGLGTDWEKFVSRTIGGGVLNVVPALMIGWLIVGIVAVCKRNRVSC